MHWYSRSIKTGTIPYDLSPSPPQRGFNYNTSRHRFMFCQCGDKMCRGDNWICRNICSSRGSPRDLQEVTFKWPTWTSRLSVGEVSPPKNQFQASRSCKCVEALRPGPGRLSAPDRCPGEGLATPPAVSWNCRWPLACYLVQKKPLYLGLVFVCRCD